jgi:hypothetical protein
VNLLALARAVVAADFTADADARRRITPHGLTRSYTLIEAYALVVDLDPDDRPAVMAHARRVVAAAEPVKETA